MELQIQDLVSSIKKDGIDSANQQAAAILADARKQADAIIADAKSQADKLRDDARAEIEVFKNSAQLSAQQAKRDAVLAFRQEVQQEFEKILAADVGKALDQQTLAKLIQAALQGEDVSGYAVEVGQVTDGIRQQLAQELKNGLELRPSKKVGAGFRLAPLQHLPGKEIDQRHRQHIAHNGDDIRQPQGQAEAHAVGDGAPQLDDGHHGHQKHDETMLEHKGSFCSVKPV